MTRNNKNHGRFEEIHPEHHRCVSVRCGANLATPGRVGNMVVLTRELAEEVMVTGDLHGHRKNFQSDQKNRRLGDSSPPALDSAGSCHGGPLYSQNGGCMSHTLLEDVPC